MTKPFKRDVIPFLSRMETGGMDAVNVVKCSEGGAAAPALPEGTDLGSLRYAYDIVYSPRVTPFMRACESAGAAVSNGLDMLIYQAIVADEIFTGKEGDVAAMKAAAIKAIEESGR